MNKKLEQAKAGMRDLGGKAAAGARGAVAGARRMAEQVVEDSQRVGPAKREKDDTKAMRKWERELRRKGLLHHPDASGMPALRPGERTWAYAE